MWASVGQGEHADFLHLILLFGIFLGEVAGVVI